MSQLSDAEVEAMIASIAAAETPTAVDRRRRSTAAVSVDLLREALVLIDAGDTLSGQAFIRAAITRLTVGVEPR